MQSLNHWTAREVPTFLFINLRINFIGFMITGNIYKQSLNIVMEILCYFNKSYLILYFVTYTFGDNGK